MRVLIADDDDQIRRWLLRAMAALGHDAEAVGDAEGLVQRAAAFAPDAVLSDIAMPGHNGIAMGLWLRKTRPRCRVVLMSGDHERAAAARRAGFVSELDKPFSMEELAAALARGGLKSWFSA